MLIDLGDVFFLLCPKAILKLMKAEEKQYSGEAEGKYFTARYQEERMYVQLSFRGCFKTSAIELKELQECGATSKSDKNGREPVFCCRNEPSSLLTPEVCFISC